MRIVVCVKQVIDTSVPLDIDCRTNTVKWAEAWFHTLNPADGWAVQRAVQLREDLRDGDVTVVSLGPERVVRALRECMAMGADAAIRIEDSGLVKPLDALATASVLAKVIDTLKPDIVLCGAASTDTGMRCMGPILAAMEGLPHVPDVVGFEVDAERRSMVLWRQFARGNREQVWCSLPALVTIASGSCPSYASLPMMMRAWRAPVKTIKAAKLGLGAQEEMSLNRTKLLNVSPPRPRPKKIFMPDSSLPAEERLKQLLAGGPGRQKASNLLEGSPEDMAAQAVEFMKQQKLL